MANRHREALARRLLVVASYLGDLLGVFGLVLVLPAIPGLVYHEYREAAVFLICGAATAAAGWLLRRLLPHGKMGVREAILLCTSAWVVCSLVAAVPLHLTTGAGYLNSALESVSGLTTTGLTVLPNLEHLPRTVLFWRSTSQLLGGLGILSFFLLVSYPGSSAHRLFHSEATKTRVSRPAPSLRHTVAITWGIYGMLLVFNLVVLMVLGTGGFDALNYAFSTTSTGGFAPHVLGVGHYRAIGHPGALGIELATVFFMALGGINYLLHYRALSGNVGVLFSSTESRRYWLLMLFGVALVGVEALTLPQTWQTLGQILPTGQVAG
ncbi:MAG: potassium transporter TrkG, partial [Armatimonadota bacterium]